MDLILCIESNCKQKRLDEASFHERTIYCNQASYVMKGKMTSDWTDKNPFKAVRHWIGDLSVCHAWIALA